MIMGLVNDFSNKRAMNQANAANEQSYREAGTMLNEFGQTAVPDANAFAELQNQRLADMLATGQQGFADITQGFQDRYTRGMSMLEGMGAQERADINTQYDNLRSATHDQGVGRGLSGTSVMPSLQRGVARGRSDALGRMDERMRQQQIGLDAQLSGDWLGAMGASNMFDVNQMGANFGGYGQVEQGRMAPQWNLTQQMLNLITGRNDVGPDQGLHSQTQYNLGEGAAPAYEAPSGGSGGAWGAAGIGAGSALTGGFIASMGSDVEEKHNIRDFETESALDAVDRMNVQRWRYNGDPDVEHVGVMAQDWEEQTGLGDGRSIAVVDAIGILTAAVQELSAIVKKMQKD